jgi:hypothetical protein
MKLTIDSKIIRVATLEPKTDDQGGLIPTDEERAKAADVITLPKGIDGTNCGNCLFIKKIKGRENKHCLHPEVDMPVNDRMCCKHWDAYGTGLSGSAIETEVGKTGSARQSSNASGRGAVDAVTEGYRQKRKLSVFRRNGHI